MEDYNKYILEWKKWVLKENEALQAGNADEAEKYHQLADDAYKNYREDTRMHYEFESKTFGELKTIFENNLVTLFKNKSNIIKEYTNLIKGDKNLTAEHHFFTALQNIQEGSDVKTYINEALELVGNRINYNTINESNKKVNSLLNKYRNELIQDVDEDVIKLAESCNYVLTHKKKISNLNEMNNHLSVIATYATSHLKNPVNESVNTNKLIEDFERKVDSLLNEEEKSFVQEIMNAKKSSDNAKQKKLFEKFKGDCLNQINKMLSESNDAEKEQLLNIKEQLLNKEFCVETLVKDMAKLLEMRDVLMSE